jgi:hypothetical protein
MVSFPKLCTPAYVYLVISIIVLGLMGAQNMGSNNQYCAGNYSCEVQNTGFVFLIKLMYVALWTWILNMICKAGVPIVSWALVVMPLLAMFVLIGLYIMNGSGVQMSTGGIS